MSQAAQDLIELRRLAEGGTCALTRKRLCEVAARLIASGLFDEKGGC